MEDLDRCCWEEGNCRTSVIGKHSIWTAASASTEPISVRVEYQT